MYAVVTGSNRGIGLAVVKRLIAAGYKCLIVARSETDEVKALGNHGVGTEDGVDGHGFGVHIANPDQAVAFKAVPNVILHIELDGVRAGFPDFVEAFVVALEGSEIFEVVEEEYGLGKLDVCGGVWLDEINTGEAIAGIADFCGSKPGDKGCLVANGVVIGGVFVAFDVVHDFADGFAEADANLDGLPGGCAGTGDLDAAGELKSEV